jgi:type II secretory pathway pseudopilin PulG
MKIKTHQATQFLRACRGTTMIEVVMAITIAALVFAGVITGFTTSSQRAEWTAYNLAAQNLAQQGAEQARAASWDPLALVPVDNCTQTNFPPVGTNMLDVPISGTNITYATNTWTITTVSTNPYPLKMIRVDCTWRFQPPGRPAAIFTNTVATYRSPNQ